MRFLTFVFPGCKNVWFLIFFNEKPCVLGDFASQKQQKHWKKNVENFAFLGAETGGLEAGGLEAGGLEARATDFGSGIGCMCLKGRVQRTLQRKRCLGNI